MGWDGQSPPLLTCRKKPIPRSGCSLTLINGKVYIFGGQVRANPHNVWPAVTNSRQHVVYSAGLAKASHS